MRLRDPVRFQRLLAAFAVIGLLQASSQCPAPSSHCLCDDACSLIVDDVTDLYKLVGDLPTKSRNLQRL